MERGILIFSKTYLPFIKVHLYDITSGGFHKFSVIDHHDIRTALACKDNHFDNDTMDEPYVAIKEAFVAVEKLAVYVQCKGQSFAVIFSLDIGKTTNTSENSRNKL